MKTYTIEVVIQEGSDEFWEIRPENEEVAINIRNSLEQEGWDVRSLRLKQVIEDFNAD